MKFPKVIRHRKAEVTIYGKKPNYLSGATPGKFDSELGAFMAEHEFQQAGGGPVEFQNVSDIVDFILANYF